MHLKNKEGVHLEEGWREHGLRTPMTGASCEFFFFFPLSVLIPPEFPVWWVVDHCSSSQWWYSCSSSLPWLFLFLETHFSSKQHARWLSDFQGAIQEGTYFPHFSLSIFSFGISASVSGELRA